jgi:catechol 2,3-dioxygenase-like lactoylglutathione lyase family enzyme
MTTPVAPDVDCQQLHPTLTVSDLAAAIEFYTNKLGFRFGFTWGDPPVFAGVNLGKVQVFLQPGIPHPQSGSIYFVIDNADELHHFQRDNGVEIVEPPADRTWQMRDYVVRDRDGHRLVFGHPIYHLGPPVEIERVDVAVRLEKRLAALLRDLADHKQMSISSCLEETLLHTFEPFGEGVASPHTARDLRYIQELKAKHGIDYECHASYRFVERDGAGKLGP